MVKVSESVKSREENCSKGTRYLEKYAGYCELISIWPRQKLKPFRYWTVFFTVLISGLILLVMMCKKLILHSSNIEGIAEVVDFATVYLAGLFRFLHVFVNGKKYKEMVDFMHRNFIHSSFTSENHLTMDKYVKVIKFISYAFIILTLGWTMQMTAFPLYNFVSEKKKSFENGSADYRIFVKMPIDVPMPFDTTLEPYTTLGIAIHVTSYYTMSLIYCFGDAFWFANLILTTGQFELISYSIRRLSKSHSKHEELLETRNGSVLPMNEEEVSETERILISCINQHRLLRIYVRKVEDLLHAVVLVDFLHAVTSITFILLDITIAINRFSLVKILNLFGYFMLSIFHMWVLDYFGNELNLKEEEISVVVYETPWYRYPKKLRRLILVMTILSRNPCRLTGGKLYRVSLQFFAGTVKTIFSYFTVLLQFREASSPL